MKPVWLVLVSLFPIWCSAADVLHLEARSRKDGQVKESKVDIDPRRTAIIICDMWDQHWCKGATERVAEMTPRMNEAAAKSVLAGMSAVDMGGKPRQKSKGLGSLSNQTSSGRKTCVSSAALWEPV